MTRSDTGGSIEDEEILERWLFHGDAHRMLFDQQRTLAIVTSAWCSLCIPHCKLIRPPLMWFLWISTRPSISLWKSHSYSPSLLDNSNQHLWFTSEYNHRDHYRWSIWAITSLSPVSLGRDCSVLLQTKKECVSKREATVYRVWVL